MPSCACVTENTSQAQLAVRSLMLFDTLFFTCVFLLNPAHMPATDVQGKQRIWRTGAGPPWWLLYTVGCHYSLCLKILCPAASQHNQQVDDEELEGLESARESRSSGMEGMSGAHTCTCTTAHTHQEQGLSLVIHAIYRLQERC